MSTDILKITARPEFDNRIIGIQTHSYNPYANASLGNNDEIRIPIQQQDVIILPTQSFLYVEGKLVEGPKSAGATEHDEITLDNNAIAFMFDEIRYELNGVEIDRCKNVGITTMLKNFVSLTAEESNNLSSAGWRMLGMPAILNDNKEFNFCVQLPHLMGFFEDYKRVIINARHELVLVRSRNDINCLFGSDKFTAPKVELTRIQWKMPHVMLDEMTKLRFLQLLAKDQTITMAFRSWDLYEYPLLPTTQKHTWSVKAATQLEKPRYVIVAFRTKKKATYSSPITEYHHCKLTDIKLYLNSEFYPYDKLNLDFDNDRYATAYDMYSKFIGSYYTDKQKNEPMIKKKEFKNTTPIFVIDCAHQNESIKSGTVDVKIDMEFKENIPAETTAYCLIIHDRLVEYNPLTNMVHKLF